jgi:hypothetical protein
MRFFLEVFFVKAALTQDKKPELFSAHSSKTCQKKCFAQFRSREMQHSGCKAHLSSNSIGFKDPLLLAM